MAELLNCPHSHKGEPSPIPGRFTLDFCKWESCQTMPLAGFLGELPFPPPLHSGVAPYSPLFPLIGSQNLGVKRYPNLFTQSLHCVVSGGRRVRGFLKLTWHRMNKSLFLYLHEGRVEGSTCMDEETVFTVIEDITKVVILFIYSACTQVQHRPSSLTPAYTVNPQHKCHGSVVVRLLASHKGEPGSIPGGVTPGFSHVGIVSDDAVGRQVFSGISHFPRPFTLVILHTHLVQLSLDPKTSASRAVQISSLTRHTAGTNVPHDEGHPQVARAMQHSLLYTIYTHYPVTLMNSARAQEADARGRQTSQSPPREQLPASTTAAPPPRQDKHRLQCEAGKDFPCLTLLARAGTLGACVVNTLPLAPRRTRGSSRVACARLATAPETNRRSATPLLNHVPVSRARLPPAEYDCLSSAEPSETRDYAASKDTRRPSLLSSLAKTISAPVLEVALSLPLSFSAHETCSFEKGVQYQEHN
ncbi:hypothetical protein PR048_028128 [Dryococelus australis]|uniref:Uncharacterized protein n=1 Tax=Dryococelus australis TaxID=614101 RepID=A0ABQ9GID4_9NEOP|nr:hypothetical protein PR048_028128 [Dryococelus australis]